MLVYLYKVLFLGNFSLNNFFLLKTHKEIISVLLAVVIALVYMYFNIRVCHAQSPYEYTDFLEEQIYLLKDRALFLQNAVYHSSLDDLSKARILPILRDVQG